MPRPDANDPIRLPHPGPDAEATTELTADASPADKETAAHLPGEAANAAGTGPEPAAASISVPGYEVLGVLGRGAMGVVYWARHFALKRTVALKMVLPVPKPGPQPLAEVLECNRAAA